MVLKHVGREWLEKKFKLPFLSLKEDLYPIINQRVNDEGHVEVCVDTEIERMRCTVTASEYNAMPEKDVPGKLVASMEWGSEEV